MLPILIGLIMLIASVAVHAIACGLTIRVGMAMVSARVNIRFWHAVLTMQASALVLMASHMLQVVMWMIPLFVVGDLDQLSRGFYFSMQNYTTLGYGDVLITNEWRILGPMEAATGVLMFGLSTAIMVRLMTDMTRLRAATRH